MKGYRSEKGGSSFWRDSLFLFYLVEVKQMTQWEYCWILWFHLSLDQSAIEALKKEGFSNQIFTHIEVKKAKFSLIDFLWPKPITYAHYGYLCYLKPADDVDAQIVENLFQIIARLGLDNWELTAFHSEQEIRNHVSREFFSSDQFRIIDCPTGKCHSLTSNQFLTKII